MEQLLKNRRLHDTIIILHDTNYDLQALENMEHPNQADERGFIIRGIMQQFGLVSTKPNTFTWSNSRGSTSKIDYILVSTPTINLVRDNVHEDTDFLLGCDHRAVSTANRVLNHLKSPEPPDRTIDVGSGVLMAPKQSPLAMPWLSSWRLRAVIF